MFDRNGNPITNVRPLTRDLINDFASRFEVAYSHLAVMSLQDELMNHQTLDVYVNVIEQDGHYGVYHELLDTLLVPPIYDALIPIGTADDLLYIALQEGKYGIVKGDATGTVLLPFVYDRLLPLGDFLDLFVVERAGHVGVVASCYGRFIELHPAIYDDICQYPDTPFVLLSKEGRVGLWGTTFSLAPLYDEVYVPPLFGWIKVKHLDQWGYIDKHGHFTTDINEAFLLHDAGRYAGVYP